MKKIKNLLAVSLACMSISAFANDAPQKSKPAPKADVYVVPQAKNLPLSLTYPAQILPAKSVSVVARVSGVLENKLFNEGTNVQKGQSLYKIEDSIYQAKVEAAKASIKVAEAVLNNASRTWTRTKSLYEKKVVTQEKRDNALSAYEQADASLALAKANLKQAQIDLAYTNVKAPISGIIGMKLVDVGDYVSSNAGTKLVSITQNDKVYVEFSIPLRDYMKIKDGEWNLPKNGQVSLDISVGNAKVKRQGVVDFIDVNANQNTSTLKMRAIVDNSDGYLIPGNFARVTTKDVYQKNVITVPQKAVLQNPLGTVVLVEEKGMVKALPIVPGNESGELYVVKDGMLKSGDRVIVNNFFRVKPGAAIQVDKIINE